MSSTGTMQEIMLEPLKRLRKDLAVAAKTLSDDEARYLVDLYYQIQGLRIASENQVRSMVQGDKKEPHAVLQWFTDNTDMLEGQIRRALDVYSDQNVVGRWAKSQMGIGPVLAAGLLAHLWPLMRPTEQYPNSFSTAGKIWRFAGLDPTQQWLGREGSKKLVDEIEVWADEEAAQGRLSNDYGYKDLIPAIAAKTGRNPEVLMRQALYSPKGPLEKVTKASLTAAVAKRPWNAALKVLCWKIGESFVKVQSNEKDYYGKLYAKRKLMEQMKNERGDFEFLAKDILTKKKFGKDTEAYKHLSHGRLAPAQIHARARRYAVKLFLSHYQEVAWWMANGTLPPVPYVIAHMKHVDYLEVPNLEIVPGLQEAKRRAKFALGNNQEGSTT